MFCKRCGNPIHPGEKFCAQCGLPIEQQPQIERVLLTITPQEAAQGCRKVIQKTGLSAPLRITLQPGVREGQTLVIRNACFAGTDGRQENRPLYVTVQIAGEAAGAGNSPIKKRKKWWIPVLAVLAALLVLGLFLTIIGVWLSAPEQDTPPAPKEGTAEEAAQAVVEDIRELEQQYLNEDGYTPMEDLEESIDAVCQLLEEAEAVTYYEEDTYCVYFECNDDIGYVYVPKLEDYDLSGGELKIVTVQPYYTENITSDKTHRYDHHAPDENAGLIRDTYAQWDFYDAGVSHDDDINDDEITVERMLSLDDYKMILWQGHGSYHKNCGYYACTPVKYTKQLGNEYRSYFSKRYIMLTTDDELCFTEAFFENCYEENAFEGAIIYMGTCLSGYTSDFAQILLDKGAAAVYVNSDTILRRYNLNMLRAVGENLCWGETVLQALEEAKNLHGDSSTTVKSDGTTVQTYVYCLTQDGIGNMTLEELTNRLAPESVPERVEADYAEAYRQLLPQQVPVMGGSDISQFYTLYDIDMDGIPECLIEQGWGESYRTCDVYTAVGTETVYLGSFWTSNGVIYGEVSGGLTVMSGEAGSETCRSVVLQDGVLSESLLYVAEVDGYWDEICNVRPLKLYDLNDESGLRWTGNPGYDNWSALEPARARVFP